MKTAAWLAVAAILYGIAFFMIVASEPSTELGLIRVVLPLSIAGAVMAGSSSRPRAACFARALSVLSILSIIGSASFASMHEPKPFLSATGAFTVDTPFDLAETVQDLDLGRGIHVKSHNFAGGNDDLGYQVSYMDFPADLVAAANIDRVLDAGVAGEVTQTKGRLVRSDSIQLGPHSGRDTELEANIKGVDFTIYARAYLVENRLYTAVIAQSHKRADATRAREFLDSFRLTGARAALKPAIARPVRDARPATSR
jgi:hypothetical protein